jgi:hypothetical protein
MTLKYQIINNNIKKKIIIQKILKFKVQIYKFKYLEIIIKIQINKNYLNENNN